MGIDIDFVNLYIGNSGVIFGVFGKGFVLLKDEPALFSGRNGYRKVLRIGRWSIRLMNNKAFKRT